MSEEKYPRKTVHTCITQKVQKYPTTTTTQRPPLHIFLFCLSLHLQL